MQKFYRCKCGSTRTLVKHPLMQPEDFKRSAPKKVACGWRGCSNYAVLVDDED